MDRKTLAISFLCTSVSAMGYLLNVAFFQVISWILVFITLIVGAFSFWVTVYGSDKLIIDSIRKNPELFENKRWIISLVWSSPFAAANTYIFNGYQIQYVYLFSYVLIALFNFGLMKRANALKSKAE